MRSLDELIVTSEAAWPEVSGWIAEATNPVEVLPVDGAAREPALLKLQVTTRSPMGAIVFETGGLLVDTGWLRILGSGHPRLPRTLPEWNAGRTWLKADSSPPCLLVADDVLGGLFAINGGGLRAKPGSVCYFAPDTLAWEDMEMGYSDFIWWALTGDLAKFYETWRWPNWQNEVASLTGDQGFAVYPFLWAEGSSIAERSRSVVPMAELFAFHLHALDQLAPGRS
jgi:hypothetical protein